MGYNYLSSGQTSYLSKFKLETLYNFSFIAHNNLGYKHTNEYKLKISKPGDLNPMFGKIHSEEAKDKMRKRKNKYHLGVGIFDLEGTLISKFENSVELAKYLKVSKVTVGNILFLGGYLFDFNYYLYPYFYLLQFIAGDSYMYLTENETNFNVIDFDNYNSVIGTILLPVVIAFIILVPCILYSFEILPTNIALLSAPLVSKIDSVKKTDSVQNTDSVEKADIVEIDGNQKDTSVILASIPDQNIYRNIDVKSNIDLIKKELKEVSGVYAIVHNDSYKIYVGSSMDLSKRIMNHISNKSSNTHLQHAINKHGLSNFSVYVLDVLPADTTLSFEDLSATLIKMEQKNLDLFNNKYNINPLAGKTRLGAKHTSASIELMST
ncbi:hypothetical protein IAQ61_008543 [Plenodomus lingam]|uniref:uncharacterized protein n=1 Tax=Leptosphaeria maculans TaxID=5022 RepID=UPI00331B5B15|nr:hypothetical protein IAQ61_008543 [Plenodomus lingam]